MIALQGKGVSEGIAKGHLFFLKRKSISVEKRLIENVEKEIERFNEARKIASQQLSDLSLSMVDKIGAENAVLFEVHRIMIEDLEYSEPIIEIISNENACAEYAISVAGSRVAQEFAQMDDEYMKARAIDVYDVSKRIIEILSGSTGSGENFCSTKPVILAADDFTPSETAQFDREKVLALVSKQGSANSHTAIFARTMGIPAIIGFGSFLTEDLSGKEVILDGETGMLFIEAEPQTIIDLENKQKEKNKEKEALENLRGKKTQTKKGKQILLCANIGSVSDVENAIAGDAEGIGLFRSEFLFLGRDSAPDEESQFEIYKKVLEKMEDRQVIIRTLDIGADKQVDYLKLPKEENPALGMRAIRLCLSQPAIFKTQLSAIYRASIYGNAAIMFPMIISLNEILSAKEIAKTVCAELDAKKIPYKKNIPIGIMIETPAAAIISEELAKECDFFSIGTNDLTQYTLAIDRQNDSIAGFCNIYHEAIFKLITITCDNAHKAGIWCGICGSLAADLTLTKKFVEIGIDELSIEPQGILKLRKTISELEL